MTCYPFLEGLNRTETQVLRRDGTVSLLYSLKRKLSEVAQQRGANAHALYALQRRIENASEECTHLREHLNCLGDFSLDSAKFIQGKTDRYFYRVNSDLAAAERCMSSLSSQSFLCRIREMELNDLYDEVLLIIDATVPVLELRAKMVKSLRPVVIMDDSNFEDECAVSMDI